MKRALALPEEPFQVLFVCTGNRARSPFAAALARHLWRGSAMVEFSSAGTEAVNGLPMDALMQAELQRRGAADVHFTSRHLTRSIAQPAQLILTMDAAQRAQVVRDHISTARRLFTFGQFLGSAEAVGGSGTSVAESLPALVDAAYRTRRTGGAGDIADPFGRGPAVAANTAQSIADMVGRLLVCLTDAQ